MDYSSNPERALRAACPATLIPSGTKLTLEAGEIVTITQTLGGNFTVLSAHGLAMIGGEHAAALGESAYAPSREESTAASQPANEDLLWRQLRNVYDPEIPVNIVDLGLVYSLNVRPADPEAGYFAEVQMTLTAPGCGMGPAIAEDARSKLMQVPWVHDAKVSLVWEPAWNQNMISEEGKMKLGLI
jgi:probable FeS assembly SUF system protein SufT